MSYKLPRKRVLGILGALAGPLSTQAVIAAEKYTMRLSLSQPASSAPGQAALHFASAIRRRSNGQLEIEVYPSSQLVREQETVEALSSGVIDFSNLSSTWLVPLFPRYQVFDLPFLFKDTAAGLRVLDGPIGADLFAELESKGVVGLAWGTNGFLEIETTTKPVMGPEDLKGLRIRIASGLITASMYQTLGAIPVVMESSEQFLALSQHTVDGTNQPIDSFTKNKLYTVCKRLALTNHVFVPVPLLGSKRKIAALPANLQRLIKEEARAYVPVYRSLSASEIAADMDVLKSNGVTITEPNHAAFRKTMGPVYTIFTSRLGQDLLDRVGRAAGV